MRISSLRLVGIFVGLPLAAACGPRHAYLEHHHYYHAEGDRGCDRGHGSWSEHGGEGRDGRGHDGRGHEGRERGARAGRPAAGHGHELAGPIKDFHDAIAPVWHAEEGAGRAELACQHAEPLKQRGQAITEPTELAAALHRAVDGLVAACAEAPADVEPRLAQVHEAFHQLVRTAPAPSNPTE